MLAIDSWNKLICWSNFRPAFYLSSLVFLFLISLIWFLVSYEFFIAAHLIGPLHLLNLFVLGFYLTNILNTIFELRSEICWWSEQLKVHKNYFQQNTILLILFQTNTNSFQVLTKVLNQLQFRDVYRFVLLINTYILILLLIYEMKKKN